MKNIVKLFVMTISFVSLNAMAEISVVVHPSNEANIKKTDIKKIFLGKTKSFRGGSNAVPVNLSDSPLKRKTFNKQVLSRSSNQVAALWSKLEFTGTGTPPEEKSTAEVIKMVANNPNMIGYVDSASVTGDVKVVMTIN